MKTDQTNVYNRNDNRKLLEKLKNCENDAQQ